jgi:hypothetical protein
MPGMSCISGLLCGVFCCAARKGLKLKNRAKIKNNTATEFSFRLRASCDKSLHLSILELERIADVWIPGIS